MRNSEIIQSFKDKCDSLGIEYNEDHLGIRAQNCKGDAEGKHRFKIVCEWDGWSKVIMHVIAPGIYYFGFNLDEALKKLQAGKIAYDA